MSKKIAQDTLQATEGVVNECLATLADDPLADVSGYELRLRENLRLLEAQILTLQEQQAEFAAQLNEESLTVAQYQAQQTRLTRYRADYDALKKRIVNRIGEQEMKRRLLRQKGIVLAKIRARLQAPVTTFSDFVEMALLFGQIGYVEHTTVYLQKAFELLNKRQSNSEEIFTQVLPKAPPVFIEAFAKQLRDYETVYPKKVATLTALLASIMSKPK